MRRLARHLLPTLGTVSVVVLVFTAWLWWRSVHRYVDRIGYGHIRADRQAVVVRGIESERGRLRIFRMDGPTVLSGYPTQLEGFVWSELFLRPGPGPTPDAFGVIRGRYNFVAAVVPHWLVAVAAGVLPAMWLARDLRRVRSTRRSYRGLCAACGYDLRASPDRCPECGAVP